MSITLDCSIEIAFIYRLRHIRKPISTCIWNEVDLGPMARFIYKYDYVTLYILADHHIRLKKKRESDARRASKALADERRASSGSREAKAAVQPQHIQMMKF